MEGDTLRTDSERDRLCVLLDRTDSVCFKLQRQKTKCVCVCVGFYVSAMKCVFEEKRTRERCRDPAAVM